MCSRNFGDFLVRSAGAKENSGVVDRYGVSERRNEFANKVVNEGMDIYEYRNSNR